MLTDLDWIATGKPFPPEKETARLRRYAANEKLFEGRHKDVFGKDFAKLADYLKKRNVDVNTVINYPQLLTKKTADFVCGEPPLVDAGDATDELNDRLDYMGFSTTLYESVMDVSRFGNSVVKVLEDRISIVPPDNWFPIVDRYDAKHILMHVIAFCVDGEIYVEIHDKGKYEARRYRVKDGTGKSGEKVQFGELLERNVQVTGADDCAVKVFANVGQSKSIYGIDDYGVIADVLRQLMWRLYCMDFILDRHSTPSMTGPSSALSTDPLTGRKEVVPGNYFTQDDKDTPKPEYLTWDGNLEAVQWEIEWLTNQLYTLSEMGAAFLEGAGKGEASSGTALRLRMTSPLIKARRIAGINTQTLKQIIRLAALAQGIRVELKDLAVTWSDGLPNDTSEDSVILERATGGKAFVSQLAAIKRFNGLDDAAAEEELAAIEGDHTAVFEPMEIGNGQNGGTDTAVPGGAGADHSRGGAGAGGNRAGR